MTTTREAAKIIGGSLTIQDLARAFGRSEQTIRLWRKKRGLPFIRVRGFGRAVIRYDRAEVVEWAKGAGLKMTKSLRSSRGSPRSMRTPSAG